MIRRLRDRRGQAMTEVMLLFPVFFIFFLGIMKVFAMLVLVQKMEIASYYAARKWQLESHRNVQYTGYDESILKADIIEKISGYLGCSTALGDLGKTTADFLDIANCGSQDMLEVTRTQVWNVVTLNVRTRPWNVAEFFCRGAAASTGMCRGFEFSVTKYVPNRDRPIQFVLPGLQQ